MQKLADTVARVQDIIERRAAKLQNTTVMRTAAIDRRKEQEKLKFEKIRKEKERKRELERVNTENKSKSQAEKAMAQLQRSNRLKEFQVLRHQEQEEAV